MHQGTPTRPSGHLLPRPAAGTAAFAMKLLFGALLVGLSVKFTLSAYLATTFPAVALRIDPANPTALMATAEAILAQIEAERRKPAGTSGDRLTSFAGPSILSPSPMSTDAPTPTPPNLTPDHAALLARARTMAMAALRAEPLDVKAMTLLAMISELPGDTAGKEAAGPLFEFAARLSPHASEAIYWLMRRDIDRKDYAAAVTHADTLLRTVTIAGQSTFPVLARLLETPGAAALVTERLQANPPWRDRFLGELSAHIGDARTPLSLLLALKDGPHPPTQRDLRTYLDFLISRDFHELAYYTWLQFLPPEQLASADRLYNGSFETAPSGLPFDWSFQAGRGATIDVAQAPDAHPRRALRINFSDGRVDFGGVSQLVLLPQGTYVLSGRYKGDLVAKRGLRWRATCAGARPRLLAETTLQLGPVPAWRNFELVFTVAATDCTAQRMGLVLDARTASEHLVHGTMWYGDLSLAKLLPTSR